MFLQNAGIYVEVHVASALQPRRLSSTFLMTYRQFERQAVKIKTIYELHVTTTTGTVFMNWEYTNLSGAKTWWSEYHRSLSSAGKSLFLFVVVTLQYRCVSAQAGRRTCALKCNTYTLELNFLPPLLPPHVGYDFLRPILNFFVRWAFG